MIDAGTSSTLAGTNVLAAGQSLINEGMVSILGSITRAGGDGVVLAAGGSVTNGSFTVSTALIEGDVGVYAGPSSGGRVTNFGTIDGTRGVAVQFESAADRLIAEAGSALIGVAQGGGGTLELAGGSGTITSLGVTGTVSGSEALTFIGFASYVIDAASSWTLAGTNTLGASQTLTNGGMLTLAGSLANKGMIIGGAGSASPGGVGLYLADSANLSNDGTIAGGYGGGGGAGGNAINAAAGANLTNSGLIEGGNGGYQNSFLKDPGGAGVFLASGATLANGGTIIGGHGGSGTSNQVSAGGWGVYLSASASLSNGGTISGGTGAYSRHFTGGVGGAGLVLANGASLSNIGRIVGGLGGGTHFSSHGGLGGDGVELSGDGDVTNSGEIVGGQGGAVGLNGSRTPGAGGAGVNSPMVGSVVNTGTIRGGQGGEGSGGRPSGAVGGMGGIGVAMSAGGNTINWGAILGGRGGAGASGLKHGGNGGAGDTAVEFLGIGSLVNYGTISGGLGGDGGAGPTVGYAGAVGDGVVFSAGGFVTNGSSTVHSALISGAVAVSAGAGGAATVTNFGTIEGTAGASVRLKSAADRLIAEAGSSCIGAVVGGGGALELAGGAGTITGLGATGTLSGADAMIFSGFGAYQIDAGGFWTLAGANTLAAGQSLTVAGSLIIADSGSLALQSAVVDSGRISLTATTHQAILSIGVAGATLSGAGSVTLGNDVGNQITGSGLLTNFNDTISGAGLIGGGTLSLVNAAFGSIVGQGAVGLTLDTGANTISNSGLIEATKGGAVTVKSAVANDGVLEALKGVLTLNGAVTGTGSAEINGGTLDFASSFQENVAFIGKTGKLDLAQSQAYGGTVSGFSKSGQTSLDLVDIAFVGAGEASFSGTTASGILTVSDGTHTAKIHLTGDYTASTFAASSDGQGGVIVIASGAPVAAVASTARPAATHPLIAAMAGLGASGGEGVRAAGAWPTHERMLAAPHAMMA